VTEIKPISVTRPKWSVRTLLLNRLTHWLRLRDPRRDLSSILEAASPDASMQDQILFLSQLVHWLRGGKIKEDQTNQRMVRLRFLFQVLDRQPLWKENVGKILAHILRESEAPSLFAQTTLTEQGGIVAEIFRRGIDRILPPAPAAGELAYAVEMIFTDDDDLLWLEAMSDDDWIRIGQLIASAPNKRHGVASETGESQASLALTSDLRDSVVKLSVQAAALGFASDVRSRFRAANSERTPSSAFLDLNLAAVRYREGQAADNELKGAVRSCRNEVEGVYKQIATSGISVSLVYRLETLTGLLKRIDLLIGFIDTPANESSHALTTKELLLEIVRTRLERRSISGLFGLNFDLFARKLIEHAGESGEHYITKTAREYWEMFKAAGGGGLITVLTTIAKFAVANLHLPLFFEGLGYGLNYSISFLAMQGFGFVLATKQPSMTAAALAGRLSESLDKSRISEFVSLIAQITRSQFVSILGNVGLVIPGAFIFDFVFTKMSGHHVISATYGMHTLETFHPWKSLTVLYAAETGVLLWLSSFGAGWLQNWVIYRKIPEALATHRTLHAFLGEQRSRELGETIRHHAAGWGGNISIGLMMGFFPVLGKIFGLPFDVRHVTLSAGQMTFAFCTLDPEQITTNLVVETLLGLTVIGFMNFAVSTACALFVAVRARRVRMTWFIRIVREVRRSFFRRPLPFFFPPFSEPKEPTPPSV
jgi:site-specific recombinase